MQEEEGEEEEEEKEEEEEEEEGGAAMDQDDVPFDDGEALHRDAVFFDGPAEEEAPFADVVVACAPSLSSHILAPEVESDDAKLLASLFSSSAPIMVLVKSFDEAFRAWLRDDSTDKYNAMCETQDALRPHIASTWNAAKDELMRCASERVDPSANTVQLEATAGSLGSKWWPAQQAILLSRAPIDAEHLPGANARAVLAARLEGQRTASSAVLAPGTATEAEHIRADQLRSERAGRIRRRQVQAHLDAAAAARGQGGGSSKRARRMAAAGGKG